MYTPRHFRAPDDAAVRAVLSATDFAVVVSARGNSPVATHLPVSYVPESGDLGAFRVHFARANEHWRELEAAAEVLVICQGPHGYVSPAWYGVRSVPTWDYVAVHAWCKAQLLHGTELEELLHDLMQRHEERIGTGTRYADYSRDYLGKMLGAIVGAKLEILRLEAAFKLSQNRSAGDRESVCAHLRAMGDPAQTALADAIERYAPEDPNA